MEFFQPRSRGYLFRRTAFFACAAAAVAVLSAHFLSRIVQKGGFPAIAVIRSDADLKRLAGMAPSAQPERRTTIFRSVGVDGVTTATIPTISKVNPLYGAEQK
jgi:hypothetical protein